MALIPYLVVHEIEVDLGCGHTTSIQKDKFWCSYTASLQKDNRVSSHWTLEWYNNNSTPVSCFKKLLTTVLIRLEILSATKKLILKNGWVQFFIHQQPKIKPWIMTICSFHAHHILQYLLIVLLSYIGNLVQMPRGHYVAFHIKSVERWEKSQ